MNKQMPLKQIVALFVLGLILGCGSDTARLEANKEIVGRFSDALNNKEFDLLQDLAAGDFVRHSQATTEMEVKSLDKFIQLQNEYLKSFPDQKVTIQTMVAEGDYVAVNATCTGTQAGPLPPFPATGNKVKSQYLALFRIQNDKITEMWVEWDNLAILKQLGLFPPPSMMTAK
jgi:steroid delta-isomerase-like uncharacterized protein